MRRLLLTATLAAACAAPPPPVRYLIKLEEQQTTLENGMRVVVLPDASTDLVAVVLRVAVGSAEDPPGKGGLAHLVEHLSFLLRPGGPGTATLNAAMRRHALAHNAITTHDATRFLAIAPADQLEALLALETSRLGLGCRGLDQATLDREREVVKNERRQRLNPAASALNQTLLEGAYAEGHPYRHPPIGSDAELDAIGLDDVCAFIDAYYAPSRVVLSIAGRIHLAGADRILDGTLARLPPRAAAPRATVPALARPSRVIHVDANVPVRVFLSLAPLPPADSELRPAAELVASFGLVGLPLSPNCLVFIWVPSRGFEKRELDRLLDEEREAIATFFDYDANLDPVRVLATGDLALELEGLLNRADTYATLAASAAGPGLLAGAIRRIESITPALATEAVRALLDPARVVSYVLTPGHRDSTTPAGKPFTTVDDTAPDELPVDPGEAAAPLRVPPAPRAPARRQLQLENGLRVVLQRVAGPVPVISVRLSFAVGSAHDPAEYPGLALMAAGAISRPKVATSVNLDYGRVRVDSDAFVAYGLRVIGAAGVDRTTFSGRGLAVYQDLLLRGLARMVRDAGYETDRLVALRTRLRAATDEAEVSDQLRADKRFREGLFGASHPYAAGLPVDKLPQIHGGIAHQFAASHYVGDGATLVVVGDVDLDEAERTIRAELGPLPRGVAEAEVTAAAARREQPVHAGVETGAQRLVELHLGYPTAPGRDPRRAARLVLGEMLDRRVAVVRERLGASYDLEARYVERLGPGSFEIDGRVDAARAGEALRTLRASFDGLRRADGFLDDFARARRRLLARAITQSQTSSDVAAQIEADLRAGRSGTDPRALATEVAALTPQDVLAVVNSELRPGAEVVVASGEREALERMFAAAGLGDVVIDVRP